MLLATVMAGCSKEMPQNDLISVEPSLDHPGYNKVSIYADVAGDDTKTSYAEDVTFSWTAGDKISVLYHDGESNPHWVEFAAQSSAAKSRFDGLVPDGYTMGAPTTGTWWALYPANNNHVYTSDSDIKFYLPNSGDGTTARIPMIGKLESGETYRFRQLCGAIKLNITNIRTEASSIKVLVNTHGWTSEGTTYKLVAGALPIADPGSSTPSISSTQTSAITDGAFITSATATVSTQSATVYIPLPISEYWSDVDFIVKDADNNATLYSKKIDAGKVLDIKRQQISRLTSLSLATIDSTPGIKIDGYVADWGGISAFSSLSTSNVAEWKATSDVSNVYFYLKIAKSVITSGRWESYIATAYDTVDGGSGASYGISGEIWDARSIVYPFDTPIGEGSVDFIFGTDSNTTLLRPISPETKTGAKAYSGGSLASDGKHVYVEYSIPRTALGSPSGSITVSVSFGWTNIGTQTIALAAAE